MRPTRRTASAAKNGPVWSRQKMLGLLIGAAVTAVVLVAGVVIGVVYAVHSSRPATSRPGGGSSVTRGVTRSDGSTSATVSPGSDVNAERDALAERAMPMVAETASHPGPVSTRNPGVIVLPAATVPGPAGVPTGYPHTPAGALAQLAAIDQAALQSASLSGARAVITAWAMPGGPTATSWSGVQAVAEFLDAAGLSGGGSQQLALVASPLMGQIKGTVGAGFVVPCVDFEVDVTLAETVRGAAADCERMVWNPTSSSGGRWMIGPGSEPAPAPSVWADTDTAINAGWLDLRHG